MISILRIGLTLTLVLTLTHAQQQTIKSNDIPQLLLRRVQWYNPESTDVVFALSMDLHTARLPGGIFTARKCGEREPEFIPAKDSTLQDELHRISVLKPDYQWTFDDEVFNFFPRFFTPSPLEIPVTEFKVENEPVTQVYSKLFDTPDVKNGFIRLGLHEPTVQIVVGGFGPPPNVGGVSSSAKDKTRITLNLKNTTLREASNAIVRADGRKTWILSVVSCHGDNTYASQLVN